MSYVFRWHTFLLVQVKLNLMKRIFLLLACSLGVAVGTKAQISFGPVAGLNLSNATVKPYNTLDPNSNDKISTKIKVGFHAGIMANVMISDKLAFNPAVLYNTKGYSFPNTDSNFTMNYIEVPLNIVYMFGSEETGRLMIHAGPYIGYLASAKVKDATVEVGHDKADVIKPLDFGAQAGIGYKLPMGLFARLQGQFGLANVFNNNNPFYADKAKNSFRNFPVFGLTVGYLFGG